MFRNTALSQTPTYKLILGFGLCTIGGAMLYAYFKSRDEDEEQQSQNDKRSVAKVTPKKQAVKPAPPKEVKIELKIENAHVPLVAGRQGANLKAIEDKTLTKIHFR